MKKLIFVTIISTFVWLGLIGCNDDCPTCPEPPSTGHYSGLVYLSMLYGIQGFFVFDTDSGAIIDSVMQPGYAAGTAVMDVSPDGRFILAIYNDLSISESRILDAKTMEQIHVLSQGATYKFSSDGKFLIGARLGVLLKFALPSFVKISEDTLFPRGSDFVLNDSTRSIFSVIDNYHVYEISYDSMKIIREWSPVDYRYGFPIFIRHFDVHPNGELLYIVGSSGPKDFFVYDLKQDSLLAAYPLYEIDGGVKVTPDGNEVWVTDPGNVDIPFFPPDVGTVFIFDAYTGNYTGGISLYGYVADDPARALDATRVDFSPDGREAYIATGAIGARENPGTILRFDARSRKLITNIFPQINRFPYGVAIGPRP